MKSPAAVADIQKRIETASAGITPFVVAVDGFIGSGKSSLCRELVELLADCGTIQIDDFIVYPHQPGVFDHDWPTLEAEVFQRIKSDATVTSKTYDWRTLGALKGYEVAVQRIMLIDGIGLLAPKYDAYFDLKIWVDCSYDISLERCKQREKANGVDRDELIDKVWGPGEMLYFERDRPDLRADVLYRTY